MKSLASNISSGGPHQAKPNANDYYLPLVLKGFKSLNEHSVPYKPGVPEAPSSVSHTHRFLIVRYILVIVSQKLEADQSV